MTRDPLARTFFDARVLTPPVCTCASVPFDRHHRYLAPLPPSEAANGRGHSGDDDAAWLRPGAAVIGRGGAAGAVFGGGALGPGVGGKANLASAFAAEAIAAPRPTHVLAQKFEADPASAWQIGAWHGAKVRPRKRPRPSRAGESV